MSEIAGAIGLVLLAGLATALLRLPARVAARGNALVIGAAAVVCAAKAWRMLASPDIKLNAGEDGIFVEGVVDIPMAKIAPKELGGSVTTSPDERVVGLEEEDDKPSTAERVRSRVKIALGKDVRVESYV